MSFSSLVLSRRPKILKNVPKPSKIPSLLSAHAGIYINAIVYPSLISGPYPESLTRNKLQRLPIMEAVYGSVMQALYGLYIKRPYIILNKCPYM